MAPRGKTKKSMKLVLKRAALILIIALCILVPVVRAIKSFQHSQKAFWPRTHQYGR
jgi:hypothetical protein